MTYFRVFGKSSNRSSYSSMYGGIFIFLELSYSLSKVNSSNHDVVNGVNWVGKLAPMGQEKKCIIRDQNG